MIEEWKKIPGYPSYDVSNLGRVRSHKYYHGSFGPRILKIQIQKSRRLPYRYVRLYRSKRNWKNKLVHRLVWESFGDSAVPDGQVFVIDHIDEDVSNNRIDNLRILTNRANTTRGHKKRDLPIGVYKRGKRYQAQIYDRELKKIVSLGNYSTPEQASRVYENEVKEIDGKNETTNNR